MVRALDEPLLSSHCSRPDGNSEGKRKLSGERPRKSYVVRTLAPNVLTESHGSALPREMALP